MGFGAEKLGFRKAPLPKSALPGPGGPLPGSVGAPFWSKPKTVPTKMGEEIVWDMAITTKELSDQNISAQAVRVSEGSPRCFAYEKQTSGNSFRVHALIHMTPKGDSTFQIRGELRVSAKETPIGTL